MSIRRKPRKLAINEFVSMIVPDRVEEAFDRVDEYFTQHLQLSFDSPEGVAGVLNELIRQNGEVVRRALYALLCEENGTLRPLVSGATATGARSAVGFLVPVLAAQFALAPAVALLIATLVIKAVAANGEKAICEELTQTHRKAARRVRVSETKRRVAREKNSATPRKKTTPASTERRPARSKPQGTVETGGEKPLRHAPRKPVANNDASPRRAPRKPSPDKESK
jgi:hypothetical protein